MQKQYNFTRTYYLFMFLMKKMLDIVYSMNTLNTSLYLEYILKVSWRIEIALPCQLHLSGAN